MSEIVKKEIIRDGKLIGYALYKTNSYFGELSFYGYEWEENALKDKLRRRAKK